MPTFDPDNPKAHHEEVVRVAEVLGSSPKHAIYRCRHCEAWHQLKPTGWKTQHLCKNCGKLSYLYPWHREEAAKLKGGDPDVPSRPLKGAGDSRPSDPAQRPDAAHAVGGEVREREASG